MKTLVRFSAVVAVAFVVFAIAGTDVAAQFQKSKVYRQHERARQASETPSTRRATTPGAVSSTANRNVWKVEAEWSGDPGVKYTLEDVLDSLRDQYGFNYGLAAGTKTELITHVVLKCDDENCGVGPKPLDAVIRELFAKTEAVLEFQGNTLIIHSRKTPAQSAAASTVADPIPPAATVLTKAKTDADRLREMAASSPKQEDKVKLLEAADALERSAAREAEREYLLRQAEKLEMEARANLNQARAEQSNQERVEQEEPLPPETTPGQEVVPPAYAHVIPYDGTQYVRPYAISTAGFNGPRRPSMRYERYAGKDEFGRRTYVRVGNGSNTYNRTTRRTYSRINNRGYRYSTNARFGIHGSVSVRIPGQVYGDYYDTAYDYFGNYRPGYRPYVDCSMIPNNRDCAYGGLEIKGPKGRDDEAFLRQFNVYRNGRLQGSADQINGWPDKGRPMPIGPCKIEIRYRLNTDPNDANTGDEKVVFSADMDILSYHVLKGRGKYNKITLDNLNLGIPNPVKNKKTK